MKKVVLPLGGLLLLASCGAAAGGDTDTLHVGSLRGGTKALMVASGTLEGAPYTIEWSEFPAAQTMLEAIGGGAIDVGKVGDAPFIFAYQSGSPILAIGAESSVGRPKDVLALIVPAGANVQTLDDLKGKAIATTRGSIGHHLVLRALADKMLPPDWVKLTFLAPGDSKAAFDSGAVDGWAIWSPYLYPALQGKARPIVDGSALVKGSGVLVANADVIEGKRALLADFLQREAKALEWGRANPDKFAEVLAKDTGLPLEVARDYTVKNARGSVPIDPALIADLQQVLADFKTAGAVDDKRDLDAAFDPSLFRIRATAPQ